MVRSAQIKSLVKNEFIREFKSFSSLGALFLFAATSTFTAYLCFKKLNSPIIWNGVFWLMVLFAGINGCANTFKETRTESNYLLTLVFPNELLLSKIVFNAATLLAMSFLSLLLYTLFLGYPIENLFLFLTLCITGSIVFSIIFTVASGISYRAAGNSALFSVLAIPISIPLLILLIGSSLHALKSSDTSNFIEAEIYTEKTHQIIIEPEYPSSDAEVSALDSDGNYRSLALSNGLQLPFNTHLLAEIKFNMETQLLTLIKVSPYQAKNYNNAYGLLVGILIVGLLTYLVAIQIFPKFWNE